MYVVHVKKVTASEARRQWFRLLDEAVQGEVIVVQRKGRRITLRREERGVSRGDPSPAKYRRLLRVPKAAESDRWSWEWRGATGGLVARRAAPR